MIANKNALVDIARSIVSTTQALTEYCDESGIDVPDSLAVGTRSQLWTTHDPKVEALRSSIAALSSNLDHLLQGPHGMLHEYISVNWEHAALYSLLEWKVIDVLPLDGTPVSAAELAKATGLNEEKVLRLCRLVATVGILSEPTEGCFAHTAISEEIIIDEGFRCFLSFQLFETRVASANLSDSLHKGHDFWTEHSGFKYAWGKHMYDWHASNPEKGRRFAKAMESVSSGLDPGDGMLMDLLTEVAGKDTKGNNLRLVEVSGKTGFFSKRVASTLPSVKCEVEEASPALVERGMQILPAELQGKVSFTQRQLLDKRESSDVGKPNAVPTMYLLRSVLWSVDDAEAVKILKSFEPVMQGRDGATLLVCDLVSPKYGTFHPSVEKIYRRRDVTLMTMHNAKQRTAEEWTKLLQSANPRFEMVFNERYSSHSCRGLWQIRLRGNSRASISMAPDVMQAAFETVDADVQVQTKQNGSTSPAPASPKHDAEAGYIYSPKRRGRCSSSFDDERSWTE